MRILLAADTYPPNINGAANFSERLATGLHKLGHEVHIICPSDIGKPHIERRNGVIVHRVRSHIYPSTSYHISLPWEVRGAIYRLVQQICPDIVHVQSHFVCGRFTANAAYHYGFPLVATNHFMPENLVEHIPAARQLSPYLTKYAWSDLRKVYGQAAHVTAPTPRAVELLTNEAHIPGAEPLSCGIDAKAYEVAFAQRDTTKAVPEILFAGRLDQEKRVNELLAAVALLPSTVPYSLSIIGEGSSGNAWKKLAFTLGIAEHVTFKGFVSEPDLIKAYGQADIFVMPGVAELQSLVTLEAMCASTPVICADAMALPHLCHDGINGFLFEPGNINELAHKLRILLEDKTLRAEFGKQSHQIAMEHGLQKTLQRFLTIYEDVIGGTSRNRNEENAS